MISDHFNTSGNSLDDMTSHKAIGGEETMHVYDRPELAAYNPMKGDPWLRITQFSYLPHALPGKAIPHMHGDSYEIVFVTKGNGKLLLQGISQKIGMDTAVILPPGTVHYFEPDPGAELSYYAIRLIPCTKALLDVWRKNFCEPISAVANHSMLVRHLFECLSVSAQVSDRLITGQMQMIVLALWQDLQKDFLTHRKSFTITHPAYAEEILQWLSANGEQRISLEDLSEHFYISVPHLSRVFKNAYGISPIEYQIRIRMSIARTYILSENMKPEEIAGRLHYTNTYEFSKVFCRFYGCRPEDYVLEHKEEAE